MKFWDAVLWYIAAPITAFVAFAVWFAFGLTILPIGCLITKENLYTGWTEWCFSLGFLR